MIRDSFPLKFLFRPASAFSGMISGRTGWTWPLALYAAGTAGSMLLAAILPREFLLAAEGLPLPAGPLSAGGLAAGLAAGLAFNAYFCALLAAFAAFLSKGRTALRLPPLIGALAAYFLLFILRLYGLRGGTAGWLGHLGAWYPLPAAAYGRFSWTAGWLAAAGAAAFGAWSAFRSRSVLPALLKLTLAASLFTLLSCLPEWGAAAAGAPAVYKAGEYVFSLLAVIWLTRGTAAATGASAARSLSAVVLALMGAALFAFSLFALGLIGKNMLQLLLLV